MTNADNGPAHAPSFASLADCLDWVEPRLLEAHQHHLERGEPARTGLAGLPALGVAAPRRATSPPSVRRLDCEQTREPEMPSNRAEFPGMPWWPAGYASDAEGRAFEIAVGAVLTQNTNWNNVEKALANLHAAEVLAADHILSLDDETLAELIRPSGFFRIKTRRLRAMTEAWQDAGGLVGLQARPTNELRDWLLGIHGVGHETADDILLYALERPVWVIDTYTRRLFHRLGFPDTAAQKYDHFAGELLDHTQDPTAPRLACWHGLVVEHAKAHCRAKPVCRGCPLVERCVHGKDLKEGG